MRYSFFVRFGRGLKKIIVRCCIFIAVIIALSQAFSDWGPYKWAIGHVDLNEVVAPVDSPQVYYEGKPAVTLYLESHSSLPEAYVLVNGKAVGNFSKQTITVPVKAGDKINLDVSSYDFDVEVQVRAVSEMMSSPENGKNISANGSVVEIGEVRLEYDE